VRSQRVSLSAKFKLFVNLVRFTERDTLALSGGYLTFKQLKVWDLKRKGFREAGIAKELNVSRQAVHKAAGAADGKISQALMETAKVNKIRVGKVDPAVGVLSGFSPEFRTPVVITFSAKNGVQIWYKHEGDCEHCDHGENCREMLLTEMEERNIELSEAVGSGSPSKLAEYLIWRLMEVRQ